MAGDSTVREKVRRVGKNEIEASIRMLSQHRIHYFETISVIYEKPLRGVGNCKATRLYNLRPFGDQAVARLEELSKSVVTGSA
jgi:hypothetical protein